MEIKTKQSFNDLLESLVEEILDEEDLEVIRKLVRNTVADILRDIWIKRGSWK